MSQSLEQGARCQHTVTGASDCDFLSTPFSRSQEPVPDPPGRLEVADVDDIIFVGSKNLPEQANEDDDIVFQGVERHPRVNGAVKKKEVTYVLLSREEALDSELEEIQEDSLAPATGPSSDATSSLNKVDSAHTVPLSEQSIQSAENAAVPLAEQSIQSAESAAEATSDIRVVETVSLSGQFSNWSTQPAQPARAKPLNALSTESYYRCGGFDGRCSFHTLIPTQLELHLREVHPRDEKYPCVHCGSPELGHDDLLQHLEGHLGLQSLALYCSHLDCDFSSFSPEEVITHMGVCHADYHNHICWRCCTKFSTLREFSAHVRRNLVTIIKCPHCSAKDVNRKSVLSHIVTSHPNHGRMVGIQKALVCQERKLNNWSGQIESGGADRDQGPPVLERIEPLPSSQGLPQGVVSAEHSSMLSSSQSRRLSTTARKPTARPQRFTITSSKGWRTGFTWCRRKPSWPSRSRTPRSVCLL